MGNDIEIRVSVANNSAAGITAVNNSLNRLRDAARDAGRGLDGLAARATIASVALRELKDSAQDAARALRSLNQAARTTDTRLTGLSDRSRTLRRDTDDLDGSMRRLTGTLGQVQGNLGTIRVAGNNAGGGMNQLKKAALLLSPALIPIAAATVPIAQGLGAAAVAIGVFGLALGGQVADLAKVSQAQTKYKEAVKEHGAASAEAAKAETKYLQAVREVDPATRRAAAAFSVFKDEYKGWTKSLAGDTMPVVTKSFALFGGLLPRLSPLVRATSSELDRLMTVLAGGVNSAGFERLMGTFAQFAGGALSKATDGLVRFMRTMSGGGGSSQLSEFMAYVRDVGPQVGETLRNLGQAMVHLVAAASDVGVGILSAVNAFSKMVNAIPTETLANLLQFVFVLKAVKLAAAGLGGAGGAMAAFSAQATAAAAASTAAGGGLAGLAAGFAALSRAAKVALVGSGIGILVVAMSELAEVGRSAPPDVDKLTTSLRNLGDTGKITGEAARAFGKDLSGLADSLQKVTDPKGLDQVQQSIVSFFGADSTPVKDAKENVDAVDKALANLVKNGQADLAASALESLSKRMRDQGFSADEVRGQMDDYKSALADAQFEAQLAAQAMGLFGDQALKTQETLDAQKASADGLRQAIQALNDVNRAGLGAQNAFEASIDALAEAAKKGAGSLRYVNGELDLTSETARDADTALRDTALRTEEYAAAARESGASWEKVSGIYGRGRKQLMEQAEAFFGSKEAAKQYVEMILKIPTGHTTELKMIREDAQRGLEAFNAAIKKTPGAKSVTLSTLSKGAETILEAFGLKVKRLPNGKVSVSAKTGSAITGIQNVDGALAALNGNTANTYVNVHYSYKGGKRADGATFLGPSGRYEADGGVLSFYANGGMREQHVAQIAPAGSWRVWGEPETGGEAYIPLSSAKRQRSRAVAEETVGILGGDVQWFAKGGLTKRQKAAKEQAKAEADARRQAAGDLTISPYGRVAGFKTTEFTGDLARAGSVGDLVGALNKWRGVIRATTHGVQESRLLTQLASAGRSLLNYEKTQERVTKSLDKARDKLDGLKDAAASLKDSVRSGIIGSSNITKAAQGDGPLTVASIMGGMRESYDKSSAFAGALKQLKAKGLDKGLIQEIAQAGVEGGGLETAGALLGASSSEIASLNQFRAGIVKSADSAGSTAADAMYGAGIRAAEGLVKGLQSQQKAIEAQMLKIAKSMEKSIKRALGIKSPSKVMEQVGDYTAEGFAVGMRKNRAVQPAWASMLNVPQGTARSAPGAMAVGSGEPLVIQVRIGEREFGELWVDTGRKAVRARGSLEATLKPPRGR